MIECISVRVTTNITTGLTILVATCALPARGAPPATSTSNQTQPRVDGAPAEVTGYVDRIEGHWVVVVNEFGEETPVSCTHPGCTGVVEGQSWPPSPLARQVDEEADARRARVRTLLRRLRASGEHERLTRNDPASGSGE